MCLDNYQRFSGSGVGILPGWEDGEFQGWTLLSSICLLNCQRRSVTDFYPENRGLEIPSNPQIETTRGLLFGCTQMSLVGGEGLKTLKSEGTETSPGTTRRRDEGIRGTYGSVRRV